jgi:hypothetical protein
MDCMLACCLQTILAFENMVDLIEDPYYDNRKRNIYVVLIQVVLIQVLKYRYPRKVLSLNSQLILQ